MKIVFIYALQQKVLVKPKEILIPVMAQKHRKQQSDLETQKSSSNLARLLKAKSR